jgi:hypothetical protein
MDENTKAAYKLGATVLLVLAVLTVIEFAIATINVPWGWILFLIAILKAWFVIQHYMHLPRLFSGEEGH